MVGRAPPRIVPALAASTYNVNLRALYDASFPPPNAGTVAVFTVSPGVIIGGSGAVAMNAGSWPVGVKINLIIQGRVQGYGGAGNDPSDLGAYHPGNPGGTALYTRVPINLVVTGAQLWGGGGGGGGVSAAGDVIYYGGAGGAGSVPGPAGPVFPSGIAGQPDPTPGTDTSGGAGFHFAASANSGDGGGPGQPGFATDSAWAGVGYTYNGPGGPAGWAIDGAGYCTFGTWNGAVFTPGGIDGDVRGPLG
jgi:hypothetical protein